MFSSVLSSDYRCLRSIRQELNPFQIFVGANGSGKSTLFDAIAFLGDFVTDGIQVAVEKRTANFHDLVWGRVPLSFQLGLEMVPFTLSPHGLPMRQRLRYEASFSLNPQDEQVKVCQERVEFAGAHLSAESIRPIIRRDQQKTVLDSEFLPENYKRDSLNEGYSALNIIPVDSSFPASTRLRNLLKTGIHTVELDVKQLRKPSPIGSGNPKYMDGSNLARQVFQLKAGRGDLLRDWIAHLQTALPDLVAVDSVLREEDKSRFVVVEFAGGLRLPSWTLSEGTLRLMALTILAYIPDLQGVYLIEEPENGVHPAALETIYQSLSSMDHVQVLVSTHSPILLSMAQPEQLLCFSKTTEGTSIVRGDRHPALRDWQGEISLGSVVASGILG